MADWTHSQGLAIEARESSILVSAAAGSGKTTTLTERIIRKLTDEENPAEISKFLIVTFTKASAADLKSKISDAIGEALAKNPTSKHLGRQMLALGNAKICTIDSFYLSVVKANFGRLGLPASFSIMDTNDCKLLMIETMENTIREKYEKEEFFNFMDSFVDSRGKESTVKLFIELYEDLCSYPEFLELLKIHADIMRSDSEKPYFRSRIGNMVKEISLDFFSETLSQQTESIDYIKGHDKLKKAYGEAFNADYDSYKAINDALLRDDYERARDLISTFEKTGLGSYRGDKEEKIEVIKQLRSDWIKELSRIAKYYTCDAEQIKESFFATADMLDVLYDLLTDFHKAFSEAKMARNLCDFNDNKRNAYRLFLDENKQPTQFAREYSKQIEEIYIDEYQDTDSVQDLIFAAISRPDNRFMVGDIKQSIYRFRGTNPDVFISYKSKFPNIEECDSDKAAGKTIYMSENFRCDEPVVDFVNNVCRFMFTNGRNSISYTEADDLVCGKKKLMGGRTPEKVKTVLLKRSVNVGDEKISENARMLEVRYVVSEIKRLLSSGATVAARDGERSIEPCDIAVLARSNKEVSLCALALTESGVPCYSKPDVYYFDNAEVLLAMSLLNVIDNPMKDVYLAAVLRSPLYGFNIDELIILRREKQNTLYDDLQSYIAGCEKEENPLYDKVAYFLSKLNQYREIAASLPAPQLLQYLYSDTSMMALVGDGEYSDTSPETRRANLLLLYDYARRFEAGSFKGLYNFINYINNIIESGTEIEPPANIEGENSVKVMTIHNSKGLEFPVCFVLAKDMSHKAKGGVISFDYDLGFYIRGRDRTGLAYIENPFEVICDKTALDDTEEEMRIFYVALTRARERLYLVSAYDYDKKGIEETILAEYGSRYSVMRAGSYTEWVMASLHNKDYRDFCEILRIPVNEVEPICRDFSFDLGEIQNGEVHGDTAEDIYKKLKERFSFNYEYSHLSSLPAKLSVSRLYPDILDEAEGETATLSDEDISLAEAPSFMLSDKEKITSAQKGTATHTFLQFCDFLRVERYGPTEEIARLIEQGFITRELGDAINVSHLSAFFGSDFYSSLKRASRVYREQRFNMKLPASSFTKNEELLAELAGEFLVVQGVIDLIIVGADGEITLCDYKTDYLTNEEIMNLSLAKKKLTERHSQQLSYYRRAVREIFGKDPSRVCIYSLPLGDAIDIETFEI